MIDQPASATVALQLTSGTSGAIIDTAARVLGTAVLAGFLAAAVALLYRWYVRERVPAGLALLVGLAGVALVAGTTSLLAQELAPGGRDPDALAALANVVTFLVGGFGAYTGLRLGDALGVDLFAATGGDRIEGEMSELVKAVGRVIAVDIPDDIDDIVGYDPVPDATKEKLAGHTFFFPRRLTQAELRERFVSRLKTDYGVGHVDVEFDASGGIDYLAVGTRAAGIGPTLPPATNAVAIRADPAHAASAGDLVQVWGTDPMQRVLTGELRGVTGEVVTVAIDAADTPKLDPTTEYKLVTLPVQDRPDREFASLLRAADETLATITVQPGSRADGMAVGELGVTVAAITREDEPPTTLPDRTRALRSGDVLYAIATPDALRKLEAATEAADGAVVADESTERTNESTDEHEEDDTAATTDGEDGATEPEAEPDEDGDSSDQRPGERADTASSEAAEESAIPSGDAFPDSDDLPGIDPETATDESASDEPDDEVPDSAAFPDTDDLPGADVSDAPPVGYSGADEPTEDEGDTSDAVDDDVTAAANGDESGDSGTGADVGAEDHTAGEASDEDTAAGDADEGETATDDSEAPDFTDLLDSGDDSSDDDLDDLLADDGTDDGDDRTD